MYLKSLELHGFKTFADHTVFDFGEGITAVVGPNGVGKSNVADAVMWVLGEQSTRALRTATARDVIFAGSNGRRPRNFAEVSLTMDNSDGALGIDFAEVTVTRRVYRDGQGEYMINRAKCRLKDIADLFMDTGIGKQAYSIVTQGQIDAVLSIRSEDRRELIEEVAGVQKYRRRRRDALRKLEATEANITRVRDIIHELEQQRAPLAEQAEVARRYKALMGELQELELDLLVVDYARQRERLGRLAHDQQVIQADLASARAQDSKMQAEEEGLQQEAAAIAERMEGVRAEAARLEAQADKALGAKAVADERLRSLAERREILSRRIETSQARLEANGRQAQELGQRKRDLEHVVQGARAALREAETALAERRSLLAQRQHDADQAREERMRLAGQAVAARSEKQTLESLEEEITERLAHINERHEQVQAASDELQQALGEAEKRLRDGEAALRGLEAEAARDRQAYQEALRLRNDHEARRDLLEQHMSSLRARADLLSQLVVSEHGDASGVPAVRRASQEGKLAGIRGTVGEFLEVPARYENAVEAALGDRVNWVITNTHEEALSAARYLKEKQAGRATFFPLISIGAVSPPISATLASNTEDVIGVAARLVKYPKELRRVYECLLGDAVVAATLDGAEVLFKRHGAAVRFVTLEGECLDRGGAVRGGLEAGEFATAWDRQREIDRIGATLKGLEAPAGRMRRIADACEVETERLAAGIAERDQDIIARRSETAVAHRDAGHLRRQLDETNETLAMLAREQETLGARLERARAEQQERAADAQRLAAEADARITDVEQAEAAAAEAQQAAEVTAADVTAASVTFAEAEERVRSAEAALERNRQTADELERELASDNEAYAAIDDLEAQAQAEGAEQLAVAEDKRAQAAAHAEQLHELRELADRLREQTAALAASRGDVAQACNDLRERLHQTEISRTRAESELAHIAERLQDGYELTPEEAAKKHGGAINRTQVDRRVRELKGELRAMGEVNTGAIEEYERLKAREDFLNGQREDLEAAKADLLTIIAEIDEKTTAAFLEAFDAVSREFDDIFKRLFDGGHTELILTDPQNVLDTGVEVVVQMPGKRVQNLLSLSGGERALTATALLFAMLRVRPAPFCFVDEVDAPLDEANVERFARIMREFAKDSQFVIITHNGLTMETADRLVGITMEEPGISKTIAIKLEDAIAQAEEEKRRQGAAAAAS